MAAHRAVAWVAVGGLGMLDELVASFTATWADTTQNKTFCAGAALA
jgi:hypothetical protein